MEHNSYQNNWVPIEGTPKKRRYGPETKFAKKRADHRNTILKDWSERLESEIEPNVPNDYTSTFDKTKCSYCLTTRIGPSGDEFRPSSQGGRYNIVNCIPCCGDCNSSKQDKCGTRLIKWIKDKPSIKVEQQEQLINWYRENEKYLIIPPNTFVSKRNKTYEDEVKELDVELNKVYEQFS